MRRFEPIFANPPSKIIWSSTFFLFVYRYFIFTSFWAYKIYYVYGFMLLVFLILTIVTVCVTIVCTYFLLNAEDYRWQVWSLTQLYSLHNRLFRMEPTPDGVLESKNHFTHLITSIKTNRDANQQSNQEEFFRRC